MNHDSHVMVWFRRNCEYAKLSRVKQACYHCKCFADCHTDN